MVNIIIKKTKTDLTKQEWESIQQPLDYKTGRSNPEFDRLYGHKTKNPFTGTERDVKNKRVRVFLGED